MTSGVMPVPNDAVTDLRGPIARLGRLNRNGWRYAADLASIALGAAPASPAHDDSRFRDAAWTEHPYYRRLEQAYLASCAFADETLDTLGRSTSATRFLLNIVRERSRADQHIPRQPRRDEARIRNRGPQPATWHEELPGRRRAQRWYAVHRGPQRLRGRPRPRDHARGGRRARPGCRADPVHARHRTGACAPGPGHSAADRPLLLPRPATRAQLRRVLGQPRAADLHAELAEPHERTGRLDARHVRRARAVGHRGGT